MLPDASGDVWRWLAYVLVQVALPFLCRRCWRSAGTSAGIAFLALAAAWLVPERHVVLRYLAALQSFQVLLKLGDLRAGRTPAQIRDLGRFLAWYAVPPDIGWPGDDAGRTAARATAGHRLSRAMGKAAAVAGLTILGGVAPDLVEAAPMHLLWLCLWLYLALSGTFDLVAGLVGLRGVEVRPSFASPLLADGPRDFWGRRWNLYFHRAAHRNVFVPLARRFGASRAAMTTFAFSALVHEYPVALALGGPTGNMVAFFTLHGTACVLDAAYPQVFGSLPRPGRVALHLAWLVATASIFFPPMCAIWRPICEPVPTWGLFPAG